MLLLLLLLLREGLNSGVPTVTAPQELVLSGVPGPC